MAREGDESSIWTRQFLGFVGVGLVVAAIGVGFLLVGTRKAHLTLDGKIQKVRIQATDDNSAVVILDYRLTNPSNVQFVVKQVDVLFKDNDGSELEGTVAADVDAKRVLEYYTALGPKYNKSLVVKDTVAPNQTGDWMTMVSFPLPEARLSARKNLILRITDLDGAVIEIPEKLLVNNAH
ncbi:MAG: hypothetical protein ABI693_04775 [Bryobacteraceae bacterium]